MAKKIVGIMDSYTEYSPSGTGVHIIAKVNNFKFDASTYYINNRKLGLEVYVAGATKKYLTITGNVIRGKPPKHRYALARVSEQMGNININIISMANHILSIVGS